MPAARKSTAAKRRSPKSDGEFVDVNFYNQHEGTGGRMPGIAYLDEVERQAAEVIRAQREGREPDLENPPASTGTPLVTASHLAPLAVRADETHPSDDSVAVEPFVTLPVSVDETVTAETDTEED